jgi:DHA1 family bicyclomycin/chloramphenicol resistance-like MFS transporter
MYLPALPDLARELSVSASTAQLTVTACIVGLAGGQVVTGPLSDQLGRRLPLLVCTALYAVASLLCAAAPSAEVLIAARLAQGVAGSAGIVIARAVVRDLYEGATAARFFALLMSVAATAPVLAPVAGGQLLHVTSWRGIFAVIAALATFLFVAVLVGVRETLPADQRRGNAVRETVSVFRRLCADRLFLGYALAGGLAFAAMFAYISGSPFVLQERYGLSPQAFSAVFATNGVGIVAAAQLSGWLADRVAPRRVLRAGLVVSCTGAAGLLIAVLGGTGLALVLPPLFLVVASVGLILPNSAALAMSGWPPSVAGSASSLLGLIQFVIGGAVSPLVGIAGPDTAVPMATAIALLAGGALLAYASTRTVGDFVDKFGPSDRIAAPTSEGETWTKSSRRTPEA